MFNIYQNISLMFTAKTLINVVRKLHNTTLMKNSLLHISKKLIIIILVLKKPY